MKKTLIFACILLGSLLIVNSTNAATPSKTSSSCYASASVRSKITRYGNQMSSDVDYTSHELIKMDIDIMMVVFNEMVRINNAGITQKCEVQVKALATIYDIALRNMRENVEMLETFDLDQNY